MGSASHRIKGVSFALFLRRDKMKAYQINKLKLTLLNSLFSLSLELCALPHSAVAVISSSCEIMVDTGSLLAA